MTEERKHAILLATVILTARRLQPLLDAVDEAGKPRGHLSGNPTYHDLRGVFVSSNRVQFRDRCNAMPRWRTTN